MCDSSDDEDIPWSMLRLSKYLFSCEYENLPVMDSHIQTCQPSADWDIPFRELLAECPLPSTASDSSNSDMDQYQQSHKHLHH